MKITDRGRRAVKKSGSARSDVLREVVREVPPYEKMIERVALRRENTVPATDVAAHWYEHFRSHVSDSEDILNEQVLCFFQVAQGADLGTLTIGRRGMPTRFDFDAAATQRFVDGSTGDPQDGGPTDDMPVDDVPSKDASVGDEESETDDTAARNDRVFVTHGKNRKILEQVKELLAYGKFEPVVALEHVTGAKPVPKKIMDDMRTCGAAVIHVSDEGVLLNEKGDKVQRINENVLIEIGAAMALYGDKFVLLVEEGVSLPSNLQGLYECRYKGGELNMEAIMKLLKAFNDFQA